MSISPVDKRTIHIGKVNTPTTGAASLCTATMPDAELQMSNLRFRAVGGTSAKRAHQFALVGNKLAYTAGGGVVVSTIGPDGEIESQRFFVANSTTESTGNSAYSFSPVPETPDLEKRDAYGYSHALFTYEGSVSKDHDAKNDSGDAPTSLSPVKSKLRVRAVCCLALSPNGRVLAVGESGYRPRILLFSLAADSENSPFAVIYEHSFEVRSIAFSSDLKSFCSLGNLADGFLHVWRYNASSVVLRASNKCSSVVNSVVWHDNGRGESYIITAGLRFLKVWTCEAEDSDRKVGLLRGRNVVLGPYLDTNLQEAVSISPEEVLVRSDNVLFVLSLGNGSLNFVPVYLFPNGIYGLVVDQDTQTVWYFDQESKAHCKSLDALKPLEEKPVPRPVSPLKSVILKLSPSSEPDQGPVLRCFQWKDNLVFLTDTETIQFYDTSEKSLTTFMGSAGTSISGVKRSNDGSLFVFSSQGHIYSLSDSGTMHLYMHHLLPQSSSLENELTALEFSSGSLFLGDKYGQISAFDVSGEKPVPVSLIKAHSSKVNDIIHFKVEDVEMLCSISRDRMIQLYYRSNDSWELMRTLPTHNGNLVSVKFSGSCLFVCSGDRSVSIHEIVKDDHLNESEPVSIYQKKIISLKATPLAMQVSLSSLILSTNDKNMIVYDIATLEHKRTFKLLSDETSDSLCVENFTVLTGNHLAVASSDKSLRLFQLASGKHVSVCWGHAEGTLGLFEEENGLVSIGLDGCLFKWSLLNSNKVLSPEQREKSRESTPESSPLYAKVTRKILPTPLLSAQSSPRKSQSSLQLDVIDPESPTRRVTGATLKRLEAKKKLAESLKQTVNSRIVDVSRSPSRRLSLGDSTPSRSTSLKSLSPSRAASISRQSPSTRVSRTSSPVRQTVPVGQYGKLDVKNSCILTPPNSSDVMEGTSAYLAVIKSHALKGQYSEDNKEQLRRELHDILAILGGNNYTELLEKYSTELVALVKQLLKD